ncbi:MAG TPA: hypothetical protein VFL86_08770 [Burkholderiaceae bacterium]|nr:hypothetical protein [Burkholderiaceae bacterium]
MYANSSSRSSGFAAAAAVQAGGDRSVSASAAAPSQRPSVQASLGGAIAPLQSLSQRRAGSSGIGSGSGASLYPANGSYGQTKAPSASAMQQPSPARGAWRESLSAARDAQGSGAAAAGSGYANGDRSAAASETPAVSASLAGGAGAESRTVRNFMTKSDIGGFDDRRARGQASAVPYYPDHMKPGSDASGRGEARYRYDDLNDTIWDTLGAERPEQWMAVTKEEASCFGSHVKGYSDPAFPEAFKSFEGRMTPRELAERRAARAFRPAYY